MTTRLPRILLGATSALLLSALPAIGAAQADLLICRPDNNVCSGGCAPNQQTGGTAALEACYRGCLALPACGPAAAELGGAGTAVRPAAAVARVPAGMPPVPAIAAEELLLEPRPWEALGRAAAGQLDQRTGGTGLRCEFSEPPGNVLRPGVVLVDPATRFWAGVFRLGVAGSAHMTGHENTETDRRLQQLRADLSYAEAAEAEIAELNARMASGRRDATTWSRLMHAKARLPPAGTDSLRREIAALQSQSASADGSGWTASIRTLAGQHFALMARLMRKAVDQLEQEPQDLPMLAQGSLVIKAALTDCLLGDPVTWGAQRQAREWAAADARLSRAIEQAWPRDRELFRQAVLNAASEPALEALLVLWHAHPTLERLTSSDASLVQVARQRQQAFVAARLAAERAERALRQEEDARMEAQARAKRLARAERGRMRARPTIDDIHETWVNAMEEAYADVKTTRLNDRAVSLILPFTDLTFGTRWLQASSAQCSAAGAGTWRCHVIADVWFTSDFPVMSMYAALIPRIPFEREILVRWVDQDGRRTLNSPDLVAAIRRSRTSSGAGASGGSGSSGGPDGWRFLEDSIRQQRADHQEYLRRIDDYQRTLPQRLGGTKY